MVLDIPNLDPSFLPQLALYSVFQHLPRFHKARESSIVRSRPVRLVEIIQLEQHLGGTRLTHISAEQDLVPRLVDDHSDYDGVRSGVGKVIEANGGRARLPSLLYFPWEGGLAGELPPSPERVYG